MSITMYGPSDESLSFGKAIFQTVGSLFEKSAR